MTLNQGGNHAFADGSVSRRFRQYRRRSYIFQDLGRFEVEIEDSKNMGVLELCLDMIKKNRFGYSSVPLISITNDI